jgi:hypothetical protein
MFLLVCLQIFDNGQSLSTLIYLRLSKQHNAENTSSLYQTEKNVLFENKRVK